MQQKRAVAVGRIVERVAPLAIVGDPAGVTVTGVVFDDREVERGSLFCCLPGARADGHEFAARAHRRGAVAFVCEHTLDDVDGALQLVVAPSAARAAMARAACVFFGDPAGALRTVGVTGTNGKTTTTHLLGSIFERSGWPSGVIGTLGGERTTPEAPRLQALLAGLRKAGDVACAMEVTSHALVQHRVDGIVFDVAVFTNLSQDHLDFHESMEAYFAAKAELFTPQRARCAVVNRDDAYGRRLLDRAEVPTSWYSLDDARDLSLNLSEARFRLGSRPVRLPMGGAFNVANALAAAAAARMLGIAPDAIVDGLEHVGRIPGRFEALSSRDGVVAIVDFAHTPAGLEEVLSAARRDRLEHGRRDAAVVVVFGCGGERDRGKRPAMGAVASKLADVVVLTSDNPRSEDPAAIVEEIRAGVSGPARLVVELDRRAAISGAVRGARPGDVVVVAGKGHEKTQQFANRSVDFDDRKVVEAELEWIGWRAERASDYKDGRRT